MKTTLTIGALVALTATAARADAPRKLTFEDAITLAVAQSPQVAIAAEKAGAHDAKAGVNRARRLPALSVHDDLRQFTKEYDIPFQLDPTQPPALFKAYDSLTNTATVSVSVPVTGQLALAKLIEGEQGGADADRMLVDKARLDAASKAGADYIRVLETRAASDVAHKTVAQIAGELERAEKLRAADTYNDIDVLRFKSAKAAADQAAVRADAASTAAIASFTVSLGLRDGAPVDVVDDLPAQAPPLTTTIDDAQARALSARPDLRASTELVDASHELTKVAYSGYVPDVRAEAVYMHNTGYFPFQPDNAAFVGLTVQWNVWDWGVTGNQVAEAKHDERVVKITHDDMVEQIRLEVRKRWLDAKSGLDSLAAADTQLQTAEEAYRLQQVRFDAGAATTTDVLDAETDLARARLAAASARYDYLLARIELARAMGDLPATGR
jgi:outer membrane protein TolC